MHYYCKDKDRYAERQGHRIQVKGRVYETPNLKNLSRTSLTQLLNLRWTTYLFQAFDK